jgi:2-methylcitrate dehydratase PrpD
MEPISATLSRFVAETRYEELPPRTVEMTKRCLLDAIGVTLAASTLGEGCNSFVEIAAEHSGHDTSTIIGYNRKAPAVMAAFANGAMAHALDFEDAHDRALVHPNAPTVPAALAAAEAMGDVDGKRLITALAIGCEVVCRLGFALRVSLDDYGWYPPPILGAYGATAAAAHLYGLDAAQVRDAFSLTLCQATCSAELKYSPYSVVRAVRDAFAAKTGVLSAQLARKGVKGFDAPFEGKAGFFALFARGQYEPFSLVQELGSVYAIDTISFKPWPTCRGTHVYIESALALAREHGIAPHDIESIHTQGHRINRMLNEPLEQKRAPSTAIDAKFSIPFAIATAICSGEVTLDSFTPGALHNERVLDLARRVNFEVVESNANTLEDVTRGSLEIQTIAGQSYRKHIDRPLGHPEHPLSESDLVRKFLACGAHSGRRQSQEALERIASTILTLEKVERINDLTALL